MIRSQHSNITIIDKAQYLWMLCTVEWMNERQEPISNNNLDRLFNPQVKRMFNLYREIAMEFKHLHDNGIHLTPQGQKIVNNWQKFSEKIYTI